MYQRKYILKRDQGGFELQENYIHCNISSLINSPKPKVIKPTTMSLYFKWILLEHKDESLMIRLCTTKAKFTY